MNFKLKLLFVLFVLFCFIHCQATINKSLVYGNNEVIEKSLKSVNGNIELGSNCQVKGECSTVNGTIQMGDQCQSKDLESVNGKINLGKQCHIEGGIEIVNGEISCGNGSEISGNIETVNGEVLLQNTSLKGSISTVNGNLTLDQKSMVGKDIIVEKGDGSSPEKQKVLIKILNGSIVNGNILVEDKNSVVEVQIDSTSKIIGKVENARVVKQ